MSQETRRNPFPLPMEDAIAAAEATLEALVKAAEDFAVPLIAEQRAVLAAADAKAGDAPPDSEYGKARAEFEKKIDELDGALTSAVEKERAEIGVVAKAARSDPSAGDEGADVATVVASVIDSAVVLQTTTSRSIVSPGRQLSRQHNQAVQQLRRSQHGQR